MVRLNVSVENGDEYDGLTSRSPISLALEISRGLPNLSVIVSTLRVVGTSGSQKPLPQERLDGDVAISFANMGGGGGQW